MKTLRMSGIALIVIVMGVSLASCSKDDKPSKDEEEVTINEKKITKIIAESESWKETRTFDYDDKGRLIESTETDENGGEIRTRNYQYVWGDDAIQVSSDDGSSYLLSLDNGLLQSSSDGKTFTYNNSNRITGVNGTTTTTAIWDADKLVSINKNTLTYEKTCKKGYFPNIATLIDDDYYNLFVAHPEIVGAHTRQLPSSLIRGGKATDISYEFDKEGYISKVTLESPSGAKQIATYTWE